MKVITEPEDLCWSDLVAVTRNQRDRIEALELAIYAVIDEIHRGAPPSVAVLMLRSAMQEQRE